LQHPQAYGLFATTTHPDKFQGLANSPFVCFFFFRFASYWRFKPPFK